LFFWDQPKGSEEFKLTVNKLGLEFEQHTVITEDGYHLKVFHIWDAVIPVDAPVVFFQHGLFSSAETWITHLKKSPAIKSAKAGYDVWLGNNRGTFHSREHKSLSATRDYKEYFDYSFYELGKYDAPAQIDFVRMKTNADKVTYIGHSQGTS